MYKLFVAVVLLACASSALANYKKPYIVVPSPAPTPAPPPSPCPKVCQKDYDDCKDTVVQECTIVKKPIYVPVKKPYVFYGRRLQSGTVCKNVTKQVCTKKTCTPDITVDQEVCKDTCSYGRKLSNYKPVYTYKKPICQKVCSIQKVTKPGPCLTTVPACQKEVCPSPSPKPAPPPVYKPVYKPINFVKKVLG